MPKTANKESISCEVGKEKDEVHKWSNLRNAEKEEMRIKVREWLHEFYVPSATSCLPRTLVFNHFKSARNKHFKIVGDSSIFGRLVAYAYPHVKFRRLGSRGMSKYYYHGLDMRENNAHSKKLKKERIFSPKPIPIPSEGDSTVCDTPIKREHHVDVCPCLGDCAECSLRWKSFPSPKKDMHKEWLEDWLDQQYEMWPQSCLLRQTVFDHYREYCAGKGHPSATPAIFGKMLFKKFPRLEMRRLGSRGCSKYYYMGIDIRQESPDYESVGAGRTYCPSGKPKFSRAFNGMPGS